MVWQQLKLDREPFAHSQLSWVGWVVQHCIDRQTDRWVDGKMDGCVCVYLKKDNYHIIILDLYFRLTLQTA